MGILESCLQINLTTIYQHFTFLNSFYIHQIKQQATGGFQAFIVHYRDDPDQQNLIDWIQEGWVLICCFIDFVKTLNFHFCKCFSFSAVELKDPETGTEIYISIALQLKLGQEKHVEFLLAAANHNLMYILFNQQFSY